MADSHQSRHGSKRTDKETQSPVIRVFKEMMQRTDHANSEKANLLEEKREKKRKRYLGSKFKSDKSGDTSASERHYKVMQHQENINNYSQEKSQSVFPGEKKDSWWAWKESERNNDETCSCVSCALKKLCTVHRQGLLCCLTALFIIAGIILVYYIYRSTTACHQGVARTTHTPSLRTEYDESELGKFKLGSLVEKRGRRGFGDAQGMEERKPWDESKSRLLSGLSELYGSDLSESSFHDGTLMEDSGRSSFADLSSVLDPNKLSEGYSSTSLRDFYKKLIKTDMQIKSIEKNIQDIKRNDILDSSLRRSKRAARVVWKPGQPRNEGHRGFKPWDGFHQLEEGRVNRQANSTEDPINFMIEEDRLSPDYDHSQRKRMCFHRKKDSNSHERSIEKQLKNSHHKDSQLFGQMLDKFLEKAPTDAHPNDHDFVISEDKIFKYKSSKAKTTTEANDQILKPEIESQPPKDKLEMPEPRSQKPEPKGQKPKAEHKKPKAQRQKPKAKSQKPKAQSQKPKPKAQSSESILLEPKAQLEALDLVKSSFFATMAKANPPPSRSKDFGGALSISTITIPIADTDEPLPVQRPNGLIRSGQRRLLQSNVDTSYSDEHKDQDDDEDEDEDEDEETRKKRTAPEFQQLSTEKHHPPSLHNPNWKGPLPLYPDELNAMIKHAANTVNKEGVPVGKDSVADNKDVSDTEYVEDYVNNKFDKLVKMAQAYSDYGVLKDKQDVRNDKNGKALEGSQKLSVQKGLGILGRLKKSQTETSVESEGIRFEYKPKGFVKPETVKGPIFNLGSHLKIKNGEPVEQAMPEMNANYGYVYTPGKMKENSRKYHSKNKYGKNVMHGYHRSLKSVKNEDEINEVQNDINSKSSKKREIVKMEVETKDGGRKVRNEDTNYIDDDMDDDGALTDAPVAKETDNIGKIGKFFRLIADTLRNAYEVSKDKLTDAYTFAQKMTKYSVQAVTKEIPKTKKKVKVQTKAEFDAAANTKVTRTRATVRTTTTSSTTARTTTSIFYNTEDASKTENAFELEQFDEFVESLFNGYRGSWDGPAYKRLSRSAPVNENESDKEIKLTDNYNKVLNPTLNSSTNDLKLDENFVITDENNNTSKLLSTANEQNGVLENDEKAAEPKLDHHLIDLKADGAWNEISTGFWFKLSPLIMPLYFLKADSKKAAREDKNGVVTYLTRHILSLEGNTTADDKYIEGTVGATDKEATNGTAAEINKVDNVSSLNDKTTNKYNNTDGKTVVKRNADVNSRLTFWNDIYDDEYGIRDPIDNAIRDKHSAKYDILSKSENWIGGKLKRIANSMRKPKTNKEKVLELSAGVGNKISKISKRSDNLFEPDHKEDQSFAELTVNMKKICREAAEAVQETKKNAGAPETDAASNLMKQLVSLMSDLVYIQVQQKTCVPLPPDLRSFLIWLTHPDPEANTQEEAILEPKLDTSSESFPSETYHPTSPSVFPSDVRTECLGTIRDVQHLISQYDELSEEDKSKMSGVREYLENQLHFLRGQLSTFEEYSYPTHNSLSVRERRHPLGKRRLRRLKRKAHRYIKIFGKKHTKSTSFFDPIETFTDNVKKEEKSGVKYGVAKDRGDKVKDNDAVSSVNGLDEKRNLPDVYYRALAESKNDTTTTAGFNSLIKNRRNEI